jgi:hypothetical protein
MICVDGVANRQRSEEQVRRRRRRTPAALSVLAGANDRYGLREGMALSAGSSPRSSSLSFPQEALYADADRRNCWRQSECGRHWKNFFYILTRFSKICTGSKKKSKVNHENYSNPRANQTMGLSALCIHHK